MGMRLIDADNFAAKIMMEAPDFMDGGSSITKAFILAMVKTRSITPTVDAVLVVRCKDCALRFTDKCVLHDQAFPVNKDNNWFCADGERKDS